MCVWGGGGGGAVVEYQNKAGLNRVTCKSYSRFNV